MTRRLAVPYVVALALVASTASVTASAAEPGAPSDGATTAATASNTTGATRTMAIEANPAAMIIGYFGGSIELMTTRSHNALIITGHYDHTKTDPGPGIVFNGVGSELGYRFYSGENGPRGVFIGPSFIAGAYTAQPSEGPGDKISFFTVGGALDVGYQALVSDVVVLSIGAGVQYTHANHDYSRAGLSYPAAIYAVGGLRPRLLFAVGYAF